MMHSLTDGAAYCIVKRMRQSRKGPDGVNQARLEQVWRRFRAGEEAAFDELVAECRDMVFSIGWHFCRDVHTAEEIAQEVFLTLYGRKEKIESAAHLVFWLRKVTARRCLDRLRRNRRTREVALEEASGLFRPEPAGDPLLSSRLTRLLARLPEKSRLALIFRYQEDLTPAEIAGIMELPVNTVKSRLQRSLSWLRRRLATPASRTPGEKSAPMMEESNLKN